jgi:hypothetical protein
MFVLRGSDHGKVAILAVVSDGSNNGLHMLFIDLILGRGAIFMRHRPCWLAVCLGWARPLAPVKTKSLLEDLCSSPLQA